MTLLESRTIEVGNHSIAIYSDAEQKLTETLAFLKEGLDDNQAIIFITNDVPKDEIRARMHHDWGFDIAELESSGDVTLRTAEEWYLKEGYPNWRRIDSMFLALQEEAVKRGRSGLRGSGDTRIFFERGFVPELVDYESSLERHFTISFTPLCTYSLKDFDTLTPEQVAKLKDCHFHFWLE